MGHTKKIFKKTYIISIWPFSKVIVFSVDVIAFFLSFIFYRPDTKKWRIFQQNKADIFG